MMPETSLKEIEAAAAEFAANGSAERFEATTHGLPWELKLELADELADMITAVEATYSEA